MFKKVFFAAALVGAAALVSCGGNKNEENANAEGNDTTTEVVGVDVESVETPNGDAEVAEEEVIAPVQEAASNAKEAASNVKDAATDAANKAVDKTKEAANKAADKAGEVAGAVKEAVGK